MGNENFIEAISMREILSTRGSSPEMCPLKYKEGHENSSLVKTAVDGLKKDASCIELVPS
jgi:hypothetical protein